MSTIDASTLKSLISQGTAPAILDVRMEDDFAAGHIPGSKSNCVFEVAFDGRMDRGFPDKSATVVVTGACHSSHEALMAAEKLGRAGYSDVTILDGGLSDWIAAGGELEGEAPLPPEPEVRDGTREIDVEASRIGWRGRNLLNSHHGSIAIKSGRISIEQGLPTSGEFIIDMNSIRCDDLAGDKLHDVLIAHLRSHDFFDTACHPEARLEIVGSEFIESKLRAGLPNVRLRSNLTLRGATAPLFMDVAGGVTADGRLVAQGAFVFDRTHWKIIYGSARFFHRLAGHLVNDLIEIDLKVVTRAT